MLAILVSRVHPGVSYASHLRSAIRLSAETVCRFSEALSEPARAGKRCPSQNADEAFFPPIFFEHLFNECFVYLIWRFSEYESQTRYWPILRGQG